MILESVVMVLAGYVCGRVGIGVVRGGGSAGQT